MTDSCAPTQCNARVVANVEHRPWLFAMTLDAPAVAESIRPGQFLMIRSATGHDPLLGRPLAVYDVGRDTSGQARTISVIYQIFGRGTARLSRMQPGEEVRLWGPLGHSFSELPPAGPIWFVAGGVGYTPFLALGKWWSGQARYGADVQNSGKRPVIEMLYGARTAAMLPPLDDFSDAGFALSVSTDDGSNGFQGRVTDLMSQRLSENQDKSAGPKLVVTCGPEPMMAAVSKWCEDRKIECLVSLENQMACGFGACFSCVAPIRQSDGSVDLRRVCLEGPIFDAADVAWHGA